MKEHWNNPRRTDDKNSISFKNRQNNNEKDISHLVATGWKWQSKGDTVTKVPKLTTYLTFKFPICKLPLALSNKLFHNVYDSPQKKRENRVHKQGIKLPLYKNRSFSKCFFFFSFFSPLEHFTIYATKNAVIVSQAQLYLITLLKHTNAKQNTFWRV